MSVKISMQDSFEMIGDKLKIILSEQPAALARLQIQLNKLDKFDGIKKSLNELNIELEISRLERQLRRKHFADQLAMFTELEQSLTGIELRGKQS